MARNRIEDAVCPACGARGLDFHAERIELPFLGESLETLLRCPECGYRHTDFALLEMREPTRVSFQVTGESDLSVRVVRSSSGTIRIPELGVLIEPGLAAEAFISNVEGILVRIERVLDQLHRDAEDEAARLRVAELQEVLMRMRAGAAQPVTLVLEDPFGNSTILHEAARVEPIPEAEADRLKVGFTVLDPSGDLARQALDEAGGQPLQ